MALRIERIDFKPWGCFEDLSLPFSSEAGKVDLIYGPNASGKSTTSRGERSLLYGIEAQTQDNHSHDYGDLCIGALLALDGESIELSRRKRRVGSLVGADGEPLSGDLIAVALGGLTEDVYRGLFQVDHETLVKGGVDLLKGGGEIGASLFAAAAGIAALHDTLATLDGEAEDLYNPRGRSSVLHKALKELRESERELRGALLNPSRHASMTRKLGKAEEASESLSEEMREIELRARGIERRRTIAPLLDTHAARTEELARLGDVPELEESAATDRSDAQGRLSVGAAQLKRAQGKIAKLGEEIGAIEIDEALIERAEGIRSVKDRVSEISKAASDRRKREGELQQARDGLASAAAIVGVGVGEVEALRRPATARRSLDHYLKEHDQLATRRTGATERVAKAEQGLREADTKLGVSAEAADVATLEAALSVALKAGALSEQIAEGRLAKKLKADEAGEQLQRLNPKPATIGDLRAIEVPRREQAERAAAAAEELATLAKDLEGAASRLAEAEADLAEEQDRVLSEGDAPTFEALEEAREERDGKWLPIRASAEAGVGVAMEEADEFERAVREVDELADKRTAGATQLERAEALEAGTKRRAQERTELAAQEADLQHREAGAAAEWSTLWCATGLALIGPKEAIAWLQEREAILDIDAQAEQAETRVGALEERERGHVESLSAELRALGGEIAEGAELEVVIASAQSFVEQARDVAVKKVAQETALEAAEHGLAEARRELELAETAWFEWEAAWPGRLEESGLPVGTSAEAAQEIVRAVEDGLGHLKEIADLERRIGGMDDDRGEFEAQVGALCEELAPELSGLDAERGADALYTRLTEHEARSARHLGLIEQRDEAKDGAVEIEDEIAAAQGALDALVVAAGCETAEELPEVERRAARTQALRAEVAGIEEQVAEAGEGKFSELAEGAEKFDRDSAAVEIEELRERIEELRGERDEMREQIGEQKAELAEAEVDTGAVRAAEDVELGRSRVEEAAIAHAKAKLAAAVVRRAIERYRKQNQDPMLERANELFGRFTLETFTELFVDVEDSGTGVLIGRQHDGVRKDMEAMSKGTREQLFLALRIAAIERYVATSGPVPVIFDDVFIESDEPRSERIFEALGELATKTQVIVLTHHRHLIEVGQRALKDKLLVQDLPDVAPSLRMAAAA